MSEITTLHEPFAKWLRETGIPFVRARSDRESTIAEGHPDFTLLANSRALLIEFKTKEGALSAKQKQRIVELEKTGTKVHVLRDLTTAIELTQAWHSTLCEIIVPKAAGPPKRLTRYGNAFYEETQGGLVKVRNLTSEELAA